MRSQLAHVHTLITSHPRLVASLLVFVVFLAATGGAAAMEGAGGLDGVTLGDVGTSGTGNVDGGPTDP